VAGSVTILQTRTTVHVATSGPGPVAFAAAFADTFGAAIVAIVLALVLTLTLRKPATATQKATAEQPALGR